MGNGPTGPTPSPSAPQGSSETMAEPTYLHGFTAGEQQRLLEQSDFLAPWVYGGLELEQVPPSWRSGRASGRKPGTC